jgi:tripartite-type tricarboxylate transporter receptor subunit TctC
MTDVLAGRVTAFFAPVNIVWPHVEAGKLKALATTEHKRTALAPDVPTMAEAADLPRYESAIWYGLMAPAGTPRGVIDKLSRIVNEALQDNDTLAQMRAQGMGALGGSPEDFAKAVNADVAKWREVITVAGMKR